MMRLPKKRVAAALLAAAAAASTLVGCGAAYKLEYSPEASENGSAVFTESGGKQYYRIDHRGYAPAAVGKAYAKGRDENGDSLTFYEIENADPHELLASYSNCIYTVYSSSVPEFTADACVSFDVCFSDETEKVFESGCNDRTVIESIASALSDGKAEQLPAHDCETYYLKFTLSGKYNGLIYIAGCVFDKENHVSYVYDRMEKRTVCVGELLNGYLPYSSDASKAPAETVPGTAQGDDTE